ncbi:putative aarF domain-containing protein kinase 5 [Camelus dromedarius]|uniref:Putative aarF domain-containing protein kinase 5 n=1 Tax=Camelus dromedarius TaxID=9838 RepID=A0A5N4CGL2_CAMDR|nr:putative aarF domain-containing protein kinase 5 [Camelus dromedarius]
MALLLPVKVRGQPGHHMATGALAAALPAASPAVQYIDCGTASYGDIHTLELLLRLWAHAHPSFGFTGSCRSWTLRNEGRNAERCARELQHFRYVVVPRLHWTHLQACADRGILRGLQVNDVEAIKTMGWRCRTCLCSGLCAWGSCGTAHLLSHKEAAYMQDMAREHFEDIHGWWARELGGGQGQGPAALTVSSVQWRSGAEPPVECRMPKCLRCQCSRHIRVVWETFNLKCPEAETLSMRLTAFPGSVLVHLGLNAQN